MRVRCARAQIVTHVYAWCVKVHVFTDAPPHHPDLVALQKRFPALAFTVHGDEVHITHTHRQRAVPLEGQL